MNSEGIKVKKRNDNLKVIRCSPEDIIAERGNFLEGSTFKGMHLNIRNIEKNKTQLGIVLKEIKLKMDFISFSETWLDEGQA